jgi:ABC-2 type transport system permease protein
VSTAALVLRQLPYENKAFWRNPAAAFFTFVFPLMFLFIFNSLFTGTANTFGRETSLNSVYVPSIAVFSIISATYTNIAMGITFAREEGILKRMRGTPLPPVAYLTGRILHAMFVTFILTTVVVLAGWLVYDVELPTQSLPAFSLIVLVGGASFCALGLAITALIPNADAAPAIVNASILPLLFISGVFVPIDGAPTWVVNVAEIFPVYHFAQATLGAFNPFQPTFKAEHLAVVAGWGLAGLLVATRFFSWEPRR